MARSLSARRQSDRLEKPFDQKEALTTFLSLSLPRVDRVIVRKLDVDVTHSVSRVVCELIR